MLKTSAIGLAGMMFSPRLFSSKSELNSEIVATKIETVMKDCVPSVRMIHKNEECISVGGEGHNRTN